MHLACRLPLVQAGRFWREGVQTFVALERNWSSIKDSEFPPGFLVGMLAAFVTLTR